MMDIFTNSVYREAKTGEWFALSAGGQDEATPFYWNPLEVTETV